jgi:FkbM family methyltransferase
MIVPCLRALTGWAVFPKKLPAAFGGRRVMVTSRSDIQLLAPGFRRSAGDLLTVVEEVVRPGHVVWDIGSNLGIFSACASAKAGEKGKVFSLEADPRYADIQNRTFGRECRGDFAEVRVLCAAAADEPGLLELAIPKRGHARNHLVKVEGNSAGETLMVKMVPCVTLDFLAEHWEAPDVIKIDVEGAELLALNGATRLFEKHKPVVYIEVSESNRGPVTEFFKERGYRLSEVGKDGSITEVEQCAFNTLARPQ